MPTSALIDQVAEFPSDALIAAIPTISLQKLEETDNQEEERLWDACRQHGFFLLDLHNSGGAHVLEDIATMYQLARDTFDLEKQVLDKYVANPPADLCGWKPAGITKTDDGVDTTDSYTINQDDLLGYQPPRKHPQPIEDRKPDCRRFVERSYDIAKVVFGAMDSRLNLPRGTLAGRCSLEKTSATSMRVLYSRPEENSAVKKITTGAHTDVGLLTLLFNAVGGLQILPADKENVDENWRYIQPKMGCALVNVGDTLVEWTGWLLRSSLHRVVTPPGAQSQTTRISLAYPIRPSYGETMRRLRGSDRIPYPEDGEDTRTVERWATERVDQSYRGVLRPRTHGGIAIATR